MSDPKTKIIDAPIPIPFDQLTEVFELEATLKEDEKIRVTANYSDCEHKGKKLLYYIANIDVEIDLSFYAAEDDQDPDPNPATFDDALELLTQYFKLDRISDVFYLNWLAAYAISVYGEYDLSYLNEIKESLGFDYDKTKAWVEENEEVVHKWYTFFHSLPIFMIESHADVRAACPPNEVYTEIDDINYISLNVINLVQLPGFVDYMMVSPKEVKERYIFKEQFHEAIFNGNNLFYFLIRAESETFASCISLFDNQTTIEDLLMVSEAADKMEEIVETRTAAEKAADVSEAADEAVKSEE